MKGTDSQSENRLPEFDDLPRSIAPASDLWPAINAALPERGQAAGSRRPGARRGWGLSAVAASVTVAFLAGLLFGRQTPPNTEPLPAASLGQLNAAGPSMMAAMEAVELEYAAAYKGFRPLMLEPTLFEASTTDELRASWADMQDAEEALKAALAEHPDNPFLSGKLLNLRAQQLEFMRQLHMLDQTSWRTT